VFLDCATGCKTNEVNFFCNTKISLFTEIPSGKQLSALIVTVRIPQNISDVGVRFLPETRQVAFTFQFTSWVIKFDDVYRIASTGQIADVVACLFVQDQAHMAILAVAHLPDHR
jgi:hypothetical protein